MPFAESGGQSIHYLVEGAGPVVVLQHGMLVDSTSWSASGFVQGLSDRYCVVCVDSLGHGLSSKPAEPRLYRQRDRAEHLTAVLDQLGVERAHFVGHSMGGWIGVGLARYAPERLASLSVGGWDVVRGNKALLPPGAQTFPFSRFLGWARQVAPTLTAWVTPDVEPALQACWDALGELDGAEASLAKLQAPSLLWSGVDDPYAPFMRAFADAHSSQFASAPGDHMGAILTHGRASAALVGRFLDDQRSA